MKLYEGKSRIGRHQNRHRRRPLQRIHRLEARLGSAGCTLRHGVADEDIALAWVPGAEIPLAAKRMAESGKYDAVIALGAVGFAEPRATTTSYARGFKGVANVALGADIPVMFGVLTTDTIEQAIERAGTKAGNKGAECAQGAIEMVNLLREMA